MIGSDGELLPSQSFARSDLPNSESMGIAVEDGAFIASGFDYQLPLQVLDVYVDFNMKNTKLYGKWEPDGSISGYFGGAVPLDDFRTITDLNDIGDVADLLDGLLSAAADIDLDNDGTCDAISLVFSYEGISAFFYGE